VDSHCHLEMEAFDGDRAAVIDRAREAGVETIITVGTDRAGSTKAVALAAEHHGVWAAVGLHPHEARHADEALWGELKEWLGNPKVVALGEMGLDYHYDHSPRDTQRAVFRRQIDLAVETDTPIIVHSREAEDDTMAILRESAAGRVPVLLHCFSGSAGMADEALELGFYISVAGPLTFKKADDLRAVVRNIPVERLMVETDAPYLAPVPYRGKRNEPAYVVETTRRLARVAGLSFEDVARITTLNARSFFRLPGADAGPGRIAYPIRDSLYLNITNQCTNRCGFCARDRSYVVKGHNLRLEREPTVDEITKAVGDPQRYREVVFCGFGEPLIRLDAVRDVARWVKARGGRVRVNTNGLGSRHHGRDILGDLEGLVDVFSVSLDAHDATTYERLCRPVFGRESFDHVVAFIREAVRRFPEVTATVVSAPGVDVAACRVLAEGLGAGFRVRTLDVVG